jgi:hypothetical protein
MADGPVVRLSIQASPFEPLVSFGCRFPHELPRFGHYPNKGSATAFCRMKNVLFLLLFATAAAGSWLVYETVQEGADMVSEAPPLPAENGKKETIVKRTEEEGWFEEVTELSTIRLDVLNPSVERARAAHEQAARWRFVAVLPLEKERFEEIAERSTIRLGILNPSVERERTGRVRLSGWPFLRALPPEWYLDE